MKSAWFALFSRTAKSGVKPLIALSNVARETPAASAFGQIDSRNCWNSSAWDALVFGFSADAGLTEGVGTMSGSLAGAALAAIPNIASTAALARVRPFAHRFRQMGRHQGVIGMHVSPLRTSAGRVR